MIKKMLDSKSRAFLSFSVGVFLLAASFFLIDSVRTAKAQPAGCVALPAVPTHYISGGYQGPVGGGPCYSSWGNASCFGSGSCPGSSIGVYDQSGSRVDYLCIT